MTLRGLLARVRRPHGVVGALRDADDSSPMVPSAILDLLEEGVLWVDEEGRILLSNGTAKRFLELQDGMVSSHPLWELTRQPLFQEVVIRALREHVAQPFEVSIFTPDERVLQGRALRHH